MLKDVGTFVGPAWLWNRESGRLGLRAKTPWKVDFHLQSSITTDFHCVAGSNYNIMYALSGVGSPAVETVSFYFKLNQTAASINIKLQQCNGLNLQGQMQISETLVWI